MDVEYASVTKYGYYPVEPLRTTQDAFSLLSTTARKDNRDTKGIYLGVYDGHGEYGGDCSGMCKDFVVLNWCDSYVDGEGGSSPFIEYRGHSHCKVGGRVGEVQY